MELESLKWDDRGLVSVVVQDRHTGDVRMVAFANREAVTATLETKQAHFYSRSRDALWRKGESSGHVLDVAEVWTDCDGDALLYLVDPVGPTCHTGVRSCFFRRLDAGSAPGEFGEPTWVRFENTLEARRSATAEKSYTRALLDKGGSAIAAKIEEEGGELARAVVGESDERVVSEAVDVLYHAVVGLMHRGLGLRAVGVELARRFGRSGIDEKASRKG